MELKKRIRPDLVFVAIYVLAAIIYFWVGLQPADAKNYNIIANLSIPTIGLNSEVAGITLESNRLETPDEIVGSFRSAANKELLIGHSSTVFADLHSLKIGDEIFYKDEVYQVEEAVVLPKSKIDMRELLKDTERDTIVIMTCAGRDLGDGDATHRLIVTAINMSDADEGDINEDDANE